MQTFKSRFSQENWKQFFKDITQLFQTRRNSMFIFSTNAVDGDVNNHPKNNLYMWSHYGDGHRGVAIEFNTDLLTSAITPIKNNMVDQNDAWWKIDYLKDPLVITWNSIFNFIIKAQPNFNELELEKSDLYHTLNRILRSKSLIWEKENEWRLVLMNEETKLQIQRRTLLNHTIKAIYLGCLVKDHVKNNFIFESKHNFPNANIFKANKMTGKFALDFEQIN